VAPLSSSHPVATSTYHRSARRRPAWLFFFLLLSGPHSPRPSRVADPFATVLAKVLPCATLLLFVRVGPEPPCFTSIRARPNRHASPPCLPRTARASVPCLPRHHVHAPLTPAPTAPAKLARPRYYSGRPAFARSCYHSSRHAASAALRLAPALARCCRLSQRLMGLRARAASHSRACLLGLHSTCARSLAPLLLPRRLPVFALQSRRPASPVFCSTQASSTPVLAAVLASA
jgi:hypothetical protein